MNKLKIFISGTNDDMQPERDAVSRAVDSVRTAEGIGVEQTVSLKQSHMDWILEQLGSCNIYIGVFSHRYGPIISGENISATEFEFNRANELQKPIFVWIRRLRYEEKKLQDFDRQGRFLKYVCNSLPEYMRQEFDDVGNLERLVTDGLRAFYLNLQLREGLSFEEVLGECLFNDQWADVIVNLAGISDRAVDLVNWLSRKIKEKNDWRRSLLVKRCWEKSRAFDDTSARTAVIDSLLIALVTGKSDEEGRICWSGVDPYVRQRAISALANIRAPAVDRLIALLKDGLGAGAGAADALGMIGDEKAVEPLITALADEEWSDLRQSAAIALGRIGNRQAVKPLLNALADEDEDVRWAAANALGKIGYPYAIKPLESLLRRKCEELEDMESSEILNCGIALSSWFIGDVKTLTDGADELAQLAAYVLGKIGGIECINPLVDALRDREADVRWRAAEALGNIGSPQALPELERVAREDDAISEWGKVTDAAQEAIRKVKMVRMPREGRKLEADPSVMRLYKYLSPERIDVLENRCIRFTQASCFNDPFELFTTMDSYLRPLVTAVMLVKMKSTHYSRMLAIMEEYMGDKALKLGLPSEVEDYLQDDNSDEVKAMKRSIQRSIKEMTPRERRNLISRAKDYINERFGILSLAESADNILMWSHYTDSHSGFVLEFDTANSFFDQGTFDYDPIRRLRKVKYQVGRPGRTLYDQKYWFRSRKTAFEDIMEYTAGLFLQTKSIDWAYEREWRLIVPFTKDDRIIGDVHLFPLPPQSIRAVILGCRISNNLRQRILEILRDPDYAHVLLRIAHLDSHRFRIIIKDDESVLENKLLKDILVFPDDGIQERIERLEASSSQFYKAIDSLTTRGLISTPDYQRGKQKKRTLKITTAGQKFLESKVS
jgi:hypothetical protein